MLTALEYIGIFVFALSGGSLAVRRHFDVVGILVLATVTALGGGIIRDVILGSRPPAAFRDSWILAIPVGASIVVAVAHTTLEKMQRPVLLFDAAGLGLFCVTGTVKALERGLSVVPAALLGTITAVGGGVLRDVLAREVPAVFRTDSTLHATPAAFGALAIAGAWHLDLYTTPVAVGVVLVVFVVRVLAMRFGWSAPVARRGRSDVTGS